ncbi:hypothetical protein BCR44DRAFT_1433125, partial [Catenaria anguillulae PL171]
WLMRNGSSTCCATPTPIMRLMRGWPRCLCATRGLWCCRGCRWRRWRMVRTPARNEYDETNGDDSDSSTSIPTKQRTLRRHCHGARSPQRNVRAPTPRPIAGAVAGSARKQGRARVDPCVMRMPCTSAVAPGASMTAAASGATWPFIIYELNRYLAHSLQVALIAKSQPAECNHIVCESTVVPLASHRAATTRRHGFAGGQY